MRGVSFPDRLRPTSFAIRTRPSGRRASLPARADFNGPWRLQSLKWPRISRNAPVTARRQPGPRSSILLRAAGRPGLERDEVPGAVAFGREIKQIFGGAPAQHAL